MKLLVLMFAMVMTFTMSSAQEQGPVPKLSQQISKYFGYYPNEKGFIVTDKNLYKPGENIWFRVFVSDRNNQLPTTDANKLYVGLFDKTGAAIQKDIYKLQQGSASGNLLIPEELTDDYYFLVAYTSAQIFPDQVAVIPVKIESHYGNKWVAETTFKDSISSPGIGNEMFVSLREYSGSLLKNQLLKYELRNGSEILAKDKVKTDDTGKATIRFTIPEKTNGEPFICELSGVKENWVKEIFLPTTIDPVVVKFFPEGGSLVGGVSTRVGFTAFNKWGIPVEIEGSVLNAQGAKLATAKTIITGLGVFPLTNPAQQQLRLLITSGIGRNQSFELPAPGASQPAFSVSRVDTGFIYSNLVFPDGQKHVVALMATHGNVVYWAGEIEINGSARVKIPAEKLPQGINLLSVFSMDGNLLAERMVFIKSRQGLRVDVLPEKSTLEQGGKMKVKVKLTDENNQPVSGNISISVADQFRRDERPRTLNDYFTIDSETEIPFSAFSQSFDYGNSSLMDVFMITNKIKGFDWTIIRQFKAEGDLNANMANFKIAGYVTDKSGQRISKAKVSLVNKNNMQLFSGTTNSDGTFSFPNLSLSNLGDFTAKATDADGKRELTINFLKNLEGQIAAKIAGSWMKYHLLNGEKQASLNYIKANDDLFPKVPKPVQNNHGVESQQKLLSSSTNLLDVLKTIRPFKLINNQVVFFGSENSLMYQSGALIVVDGQQMGTDVSVINNLSPTDVDHINVSTNPVDIQRYTGLNSVGLIEIWLKRAKIAEAKNERRKYNGEYRVPDLFPAWPANSRKDNRTTLLWIPEQAVDSSGQFEFTVNSGKVLSDFEICVQGISNTGVMGSGSGKITVVK